LPIDVKPRREASLARRLWQQAIAPEAGADLGTISLIVNSAGAMLVTELL
jgi:hypothetical protein